MAMAAILAFCSIVIAAATMPSKAADPLPNWTYLNQNWNTIDRDLFYYTSQGSELIPYEWFLSLEQAGSQTLFHENLQRFGFLIGPHSLLNPDRLPLGFVIP